MDYKKKIITLLDKVKTEQTFKQVYKLLEYLYLREAQDGLQERDYQYDRKDRKQMLVKDNICIHRDID